VAKSQNVLLIQTAADDHTDLAALLQGAEIGVQRVNHPRLIGRYANGARPCVIVFDTELPPPGGMAVMQSLQEACSCGVIVLCANADSVDCILGLEMGADDVVARTRDPREIFTRIRRLMQRSAELREPANEQSRIVFTDWCLDLDRRELTHQDGHRVHLTRGEFELLAALASHQGRVMARDQLLDHISHRDWAPNDRTVDVLLNRLRHKLGEPSREPRHLVTVHGVGYVFNP